MVGGTGLYLRAALAELSLRPPPAEGVRERWLRELERRGSAALHAVLRERAPWAAEEIEPGDRQRIVRALELLDAGELERRAEDSELWTANTRRPTLLVGLVLDRQQLYERIDARVDAMLAAGAQEEVRRANAAGASGTARKALGFDELLAGDVESMKRRTRNYARRQLTWMRKLAAVHTIDASGRSPDAVAAEVLGLWLRTRAADRVTPGRLAQSLCRRCPTDETANRRRAAGRGGGRRREGLLGLLPPSPADRRGVPAARDRRPGGHCRPGRRGVRGELPVRPPLPGAGRRLGPSLGAGDRAQQAAREPATGRVEDKARRRLAFEPEPLDDDDLARVDELAAAADQPSSSWSSSSRNASATRSARVCSRSGNTARSPASCNCSELVARQRVSRGLARLRDQLREGER